MANILPFAETEPAILTDGDGFLASGGAFKALHMVVPYACELIARIQKRPPIIRQLTQPQSIGFNGDLLVTVLIRMR